MNKKYMKKNLEVLQNIVKYTLSVLSLMCEEFKTSIIILVDIFYA